MGLNPAQAVISSLSSQTVLSSTPIYSCLRVRVHVCSGDQGKPSHRAGWTASKIMSNNYFCCILFPFFILNNWTCCRHCNWNWTHICFNAVWGIHLYKKPWREAEDVLMPPTPLPLSRISGPSFDFTLLSLSLVLLCTCVALSISFSASWPILPTFNFQKILNYFLLRYRLFGMAFV